MILGLDDRSRAPSLAHFPALMNNPGNDVSNRMLEKLGNFAMLSFYKVG